MYPFHYRRPTTLSQAVAMLEDDGEAWALGGGQTLIPTLKQRLAHPSALVDLTHLPELQGIRDDGDRLAIGAVMRHAEVAAAPLVRRRLPALAALAGDIGDRQVRNLGTLGGAIANADPAADYPAAVLALDATIATSRRSVSADDFFTGMFETALEPGELVVSVAFRIPDAAAYAKFPNPASRYAVVGVFVARFGDRVRIAVTGACAHAVRLPHAEAALERRFAAEVVDGMTFDTLDLNSDCHADSEYRAHLLGVMLRRAIGKCC